MKMKPDTIEEKIQKLKIVCSLCDAYGKKLSDDTVEFIVDSLDTYSVKAVREAAKIMMREKSDFKVSHLTDIIYEFKLFEEPEVCETVIVMSPEEHEAWRNEIERQEMEMTKEEWEVHLKECEDFWKDKPATGWEVYDSNDRQLS